MYRKVEPIPDFPAMENRILAFWQEVDAFEALRDKNKGNPRWSFLDGPITANNPMGVHHAWGRSLKDMYQRYHAMLGHEQRYQNGFDCQGLWVEVEVEKELGFTSKDDIAAYGIDRFVQRCKERVERFSQVQTEQSIRLGYWMDWNHSYYTMSDENNYTIWSFLKKCHQRGFVYKGFDVMPWCPRCGVGLSQMEMHEGYLTVKDRSVVVRFPLREREKEALLVWTTTPWTLTSNVAAAVHPEMYYFKVKQGDWTYYVGAENWENDRTRDSEGNRTGLKNLPDLVGRRGPFEVLGSVSGRELVDLHYQGPFDDLEAQAAPGGHPYPDPKLAQVTGKEDHRVIWWEQVTGTEGTGIVHIAPGCGKEDYELSRDFGLVSIAPLDERGNYIDGFGWLTGKNAAQVAEQIIAELDRKGFLVAQEDYPHTYPHCWRCKTPVLFRLVDEWYISMEWRKEIMQVVDEIQWIPAFGHDREMDWLKNMRDWMISKKRYWGLALPIWVCEQCSHFEVIGGRQELKERAVEGWDRFEGHSPHRPWIDEVTLRCERCGGRSRRIPDVGNPWLDAGIVPFSTMGYNSDREYWERWFPADLVLECFPGQFRNWFYSLLAMSTMMEGKAPFRTLLGHALVRDEYGEEMHKSLGNAIEFNEAAEKMGAEIMRFIFAAQNPVNNLNFPDIHRRRQEKKRHLDDEVRRKLLTFWNCYSFYIQYAEVDGVRPGQFAIPPAERPQLDRWILSRLQHLVEHARQCFESYQIHLLMERFQAFVESDLSNWYLRRSRRRFWKSGSDADKQAAYATLYEVLLTCIRLVAPILPFLTEEMYSNMVRSVDTTAPPSVHLTDYPQADTSLIDEPLEASFGALIRYKNLGLALRNEANIKVRQPLATFLVQPESDTERQVLGDPNLVEVLLEELNTKNLELLDDTGHLISTRFKTNFATLGPRYGELTPRIAEHIDRLDPTAIEEQLKFGELRFEIDDHPVVLTPEDLERVHTGPQGLVFAFDGGAFVGLETRLTPELVQEGMARDFVRHVQNLRKERGLQIEDRIHLRYSAGAEVSRALERWSSYIGNETLALRFASDPSLQKPAAAEIKIAKERVLIDLEKAAG
ncbi:MAG: isoleucine--tRNA ligase [Bradymonadales bacterium]|nr:isoleucine--tRNA ligase [Bradymonadales bacterium]